MININELIAQLPQTDNRTEPYVINARKLFKRSFITWTDKEDLILSYLCQQKTSISQISQILERTEKAIDSRIKSKNLTDFPECPLEAKNEIVADSIDFNNRDSALNLLHYWRSSLADESKLGLSPKTMRKGASFSLNHFASGNLPAPDIQRFFLEAEELIRKKNRFSDHNKTEINIKKLPVIIAPYTAVKKYENTREIGANTIKECFPLWLTAVLTKDGILLPDEENTYPWLERRCLSPNEMNEKNLGFPIIGDIRDVDNYYITNNEIINSEKKDWNIFFNFAHNLLQLIIKKEPNIFEKQNFLLLEKGYILPLVTTQDAVKPILNTYDQYLFTKNRELPSLLKSFLSFSGDETESKISNIDFTDLLLTNQKHLGQMEKKYPLSKSQRLSMNYHLYQHDNEIFTIHGPPGTGKTTLLLSVIASQWVEAAIEKKMPPLIVASSTNNLAVTNILDSFNKAKEESILENRWLPDINSFGTYLCSSLKKEDAEKKSYLYALLKEDAGSLARFYDEDYRVSATLFFLDQFNACFNKEEKDLQSCIRYIHQQLIAKKILLTETINLVVSYKSIQNELLQYADNLQSLYILIKSHEDERANLELLKHNIKELRARWFLYQSTKLKWLKIFRSFTFIKTLLSEKTKLFTAQEHLFFDELIDIPEKVDVYFEKKINTNKLAREQNQEKLSQLNAIREITEDFNEKKFNLEKQLGFEILLDKIYDYTDLQHINCQLDKTLRYELFVLTSHYWEANWLLESSSVRSLEKTLVGRQKYWQIQSMLTPCFVTTFYTGPAFFSYLAPSKEFETLNNFIDLLIIDEAGQALPALSAAMISIAKKALLVGDAMQIEPVFKIPENIDIANAKKFLLCKNNSEYDKLKNLGILCSGNPYTGQSYGNLIIVGQRKTKYHLQDQKLPGMLLLEHRRCPKDIINYCNELCYDNQLIPLAIEKESVFPRMGYAHFKGFEEKSGGSRCNKTEAKIIADWVAKNKNKILNDCQQEELDDCLAIITPFAAQRNEIQAALLQHGICLDKVGTVHSLQGAEKDIIIFSPVYSADNNQVNFFFDKTPNMLNVAVSRAKRSFLVFGDMDIFNPSGNSPSSLLAKYLFASEHNEIIDISIPPLAEAKLEEIEVIISLRQHRQQLISCFTNAQYVLNIISPYLTKSAIKYDDIEQHIADNSSRITINIYTDPFLNKNNKYFEEILISLTAAGANVFLVERVHSKIITIDDKAIIVGSFNWLSASRDNPDYIREETSLIHRGERTFSLIEKALKPIKEKVKREIRKTRKEIID
ncbi:AAA domain-containing protein [Legionella dresdenensis]|uniref:AAA domain-containing protein n=1 Tax=Legionella dresdenensis TaxID=450200 RepID=A0ABV8CCM9_9GAMM